MKKKYFLYANNSKVEVSREIYKAYWKDMEKEKYQNHVLRRNSIYLDDHFEGYERNTVEYQIILKIQQIKEEKENEKVLTEKLNKALDQLKPEERLLINLLYFEDWNQNEVIERFDYSQQNISRIHKRVLRKLRYLMDQD